MTSTGPFVDMDTRIKLLERRPKRNDGEVTLTGLLICILIVQVFISAAVIRNTKQLQQQDTHNVER